MTAPVSLAAHSSSSGRSMCLHSLFSTKHIVPSWNYSLIHPNFRPKSDDEEDAAQPFYDAHSGQEIQDNRPRIMVYMGYSDEEPGSQYDSEGRLFYVTDEQDGIPQRLADPAGGPNPELYLMDSHDFVQEVVSHWSRY